jgi:hypothetical protein
LNLLCGGFCARCDHVAVSNSAVEAATATRAVPFSNPCVPVFWKAGTRRYGREIAAVVFIVIAEAVVMVTDVRSSPIGQKHSTDAAACANEHTEPSTVKNGGKSNAFSVKIKWFEARCRL